MKLLYTDTDSHNRKISNSIPTIRMGDFTSIQNLLNHKVSHFLPINSFDFRIVSLFSLVHHNGCSICSWWRYQLYLYYISVWTLYCKLFLTACVRFYVWYHYDNDTIGRHEGWTMNDFCNWFIVIYIHTTRTRGSIIWFEVQGSNKQHLFTKHRCRWYSYNYNFVFSNSQT